MAQRILISSDWGDVEAELVDNAARSLAGMLPLTIEMSDHLRQEKTGIYQRRCPNLDGNVRSLRACSACGVPIIS